jgi:predicted dehydrogenase
LTALLKAAVVGAGMIGARLDAPGVATPLTHAGGYRAAGFSLVALVDCDAGVRELAQQWTCRAYGSLDEMMRAEQPQVVSLAVPTSVRGELLRRALQYRPAAVVAEKPLTGTVTEAEDIVAAYRRAGVPLIVNYTRRFVPAWRQLSGTTAISTTIRYAKGVRHNGTHAIDLCRMLFGECRKSQALARKHDFWSDDATVSAFLQFDRCPEVFLQGLDERCFTLFEVDIVGADFRIVVDRDGRRLRRYGRAENAGIPPGNRLVENGEEGTGAESAMVNLMRHVHDVVSGAAPLCAGEDAVAAQRIAERLAA